MIFSVTPLGLGILGIKRPRIPCLPNGGAYPEECCEFWRIGSWAVTSIKSPMEFEVFESSFHCCQWFTYSKLGLVGGRDFGNFGK